MLSQTNNANSLHLAMAYVPVQQLETVYSPLDALVNGTLFPALCKPFLAYNQGGARYDG